jgi:hypothetical protein
MRLIYNCIKLTTYNNSIVIIYRCRIIYMLFIKIKMNAYTLMHNIRFQIISLCRYKIFESNIFLFRRFVFSKNSNY